jgi:hypothetical protein
MIAYPAQAKELVQLLQKDQAEKRAAGRAFFEAGDKSSLDIKHAELAAKSRQRAQRMLQILDEIGEPSLSNLGTDAAQAVSVLAVHTSFDTLRRVLIAFNACYERNKDDAYYQAIPSMTDWILLLERKPQRFGTQWLFDENKQPFLPTVEYFDRVNERRAEYSIEPLRWPKSLAIPESQQPWLKRPLSEVVMREPTDDEFAEFSKNLLD